MKKLTVSFILVMFVFALCWANFGDEQQSNITAIKMDKHIDFINLDNFYVIIQEPNEAEGYTYLVQARCVSCGGNGYIRCQTCNGTGQVRSGTSSGSGGTTTTYRTCNSCGGAGQRVCGSCRGRGVR